MNDIAKYAKHAHTAGVYLAPFFCLLALGVVLNVTNPLETGAVSILLVFILLYFLILSTLAALFHLFGSVWRMVKPQKPIHMRRGYYLLSIVSLAPVLFVALNTLGQLETLEMVLIILLVCLGCFYVLRRTTK
jgi:uncharacterized membrane protein